MSRVAASRTEPTPFRFTVEDYHMLSELGVLGETTRTELIEGEIFEMPPADPEHAGHVIALNERLIRRLPQKYHVRGQVGVYLSSITEPEPDVAVVKARADKYTRAHPTPAETLLVVEVAKSSLSYDLTKKAAIYAASGIKEYWVLDLVERRLHVFTRPSGDVWKQHVILTARETVQSTTIPELKLKVSELFV